jgi:hypothetical protein
LSKLPSCFTRKTLKALTKLDPAQTVEQAIKHLEAAGGEIIKDKPAPDKSPRWVLNFDGWSHGGVPGEGLIRIANEHATKRPPAKRKAAPAK